MANKHFQVFNTISCQRNTNENYLDILSHDSQNGYHQGKKYQILVKIWGKGNAYLLLVGIQTMKLVERFLKMLRIELPYDPAISLLGICLQDSTPYYRNTCSSIFIIARKQFQPRCPSNDK